MWRLVVEWVNVLVERLVYLLGATSIFVGCGG